MLEMLTVDGLEEDEECATFKIIIVHNKLIHCRHIIVVTPTLPFSHYFIMYSREM